MWKGISVRLPDEIHERLEKLSKFTGRTKTYYILELLKKHLDELEDYYLSAAVLERVRKGEEEVLTLEEVERELGLAD